MSNFNRELFPFSLIVAALGAACISAGAWAADPDCTKPDLTPAEKEQCTIRHDPSAYKLGMSMVSTNGAQDEKVLTLGLRADHFKAVDTDKGSMSAVTTDADINMYGENGNTGRMDIQGAIGRRTSDSNLYGMLTAGLSLHDDDEVTDSAGIDAGIEVGVLNVNLAEHSAVTAGFTYAVGIGNVARSSSGWDQYNESGVRIRTLFSNCFGTGESLNRRYQDDIQTSETIDSLFLECRLKGGLAPYVGMNRRLVRTLESDPTHPLHDGLRSKGWTFGLRVKTAR